LVSYFTRYHSSWRAVTMTRVPLVNRARIFAVLLGSRRMRATFQRTVALPLAGTMLLLFTSSGRSNSTKAYTV